MKFTTYFGPWTLDLGLESEFAKLNDQHTAHDQERDHVKKAPDGFEGLALFHLWISLGSSW